MAGLRASAEIQYDTLANAYGDKTNLVAADCSTLDLSTAAKGLGSIFANSNIQQALAHAKAQGGEGFCTIKADGSAYAIAFPLKSAGYWCIDSTGVARGTVAGGTTPYTATNGGANSAILTNTYACN